MDERELIERYNDAWNAHDVDAIASMHADDIVFHNYSAGERAEGANAVRAHIAQILRNSPDLQFAGRRLYVRTGLVVNEWTATATRNGKRMEWDGIDVFPIEDGKIKRKDVYSGAGVAREVGS
ncbi:MAG: nuclear transport factor 2 family protein [Gaiellaceae bacterium]